MYAARERLDEHGRLIGKRVRHFVQLARMRHQHLAPAATCVGTVSGLQADLNWSFSHVVAEPGAPFRTSRARWLDAAHLAAEGGLNHDARTVFECANHLV